MSLRYFETHRLGSDEEGANATVTVHLSGVSLLRAMEFVDRVLEAAGEFALEAETPISPPDLTVSPGETVIRPQTSGPCVHIDQATEDDLEEIQALGLACRHPGRLHQRGDECPQEWECPHLDNPDVLCSVRDACYAMAEVARMRDECKTGQDLAPRSDCVLAPREPPAEIKGPGVAPVDVSEPETKPAPKRGWPGVREWTPEQERAMCGATTPAEAVALYRATFPDSERSDASIKTRYRLKIRPQRGATPAPDFAGDTVPVTQCDEEAFAVPRPTFRPGDRVRIKHALHRGQTGKIERYFPATDNYLVAIDGLPDRIILTDAQMEAV